MEPINNIFSQIKSINGDPESRSQLKKSLEALASLSRVAKKADECEAIVDLFYNLISVSAEGKLVEKGKEGYWEADIPNLSFLKEEGVAPEEGSTTFRITKAAEEIRTNLVLDGGKSVGTFSLTTKPPSGKKKRVAFAETIAAKPLRIDVSKGQFQAVKQVLQTKFSGSGYYFELMGLLDGMLRYLQRSDLTLNDLVAVETWLQELGKGQPYRNVPTFDPPEKMVWPPFEINTVRKVAHFPDTITRTYALVYEQLLTQLSYRYSQITSAHLQDFDFESFVLYSIAQKKRSLLDTFFKQQPQKFLLLLVKWVQNNQLVRIKTLFTLDYKEIINLKDEKGFTALYYALQGKELYTNLIEFLLDSGASCLVEHEPGKCTLALFSRQTNCVSDHLELLCKRAKRELSLLTVTFSPEKLANVAVIIHKIKLFSEVENLPKKYLKYLLEEIEDFPKKCKQFKIKVPQTQTQALVAAKQRVQNLYGKL